MRHIGSPRINIVSFRKLPAHSSVYIHPLLQDMNRHEHRQTNSARLSVAVRPVTCFHYISIFTTVADTPKHTHVHENTPPVHIKQFLFCLQRNDKANTKCNFYRIEFGL